METDSYYHLIVLFFLLILSAIFSGSEVALFSLDKKKIKEFKKDSLVETYITSLLEYPRRLLVTILLGNTITNVAISLVSVIFALEIANNLNLEIDIVIISQIIITTILILIIGEITPKIWANKNPVKFSKFIAIPIYWISVLLYPPAKILTDIIKALFSRIKYDKTRTAILSSELAELATLGVEKGTIEEDEHELIHGLVSIKSVTAREVMTPRVDISAVEVGTSFEELMNIITESGHSRLPLYEENLDHIVGVIYAKDLLPYLRDDHSKELFSLRKICRKVVFVPESKLINVLMHEFQEMNTHVGIVVDEYGGTAGLISLEDILEEIVGEIRDEYDQEEQDIVKLDGNSYLVLGKTSIDELNELMDSNFSSEIDDYDTIGGFILNHSGEIPKDGYSFTFNNCKFTVKEVSNKRINKVIVQKLNVSVE
ncbi:MAG: hemolysin family protein [bacterium]